MTTVRCYSKDGTVSRVVNALELVLKTDDSGTLASFSITEKDNDSCSECRVDANSWIEITYEDDVSNYCCFKGRVREFEYDSASRTFSVSCDDVKRLLFEVPYFGQSNHVVIGRHSRHKYVLGDWTVADALNDFVKNACGRKPNGDLFNDGLPTVFDSVPSSVAGNWHTSGMFTSLSPSIDMFSFEGQEVSVGELIDNTLRHYYPKYRWYYDPRTDLLKTIDITVVSEFVLDLASNDRNPWYADISPSYDGVYSRVIVEGQETTRVSYTSGVTGFLNQNAPVGSRTGTEIHFTHRDPPESYYVSRTVTENGIDNETYEISVTYGDWSNAQLYTGSNPPSDQIFWDEDTSSWAGGAKKDGKYGQDVRHLVDSDSDPQWKTATDSMYYMTGVNKCLVVCDDTVGPKVYVQDGNSETTDRTVEQQAMVDQLIAVLSKTKWLGSLSFKNRPELLPYQRVTLKNMPRYGTTNVTLASLSWSDATNTYTTNLGDNKYNPMDDINLKREIKQNNSTEKYGRRYINAKNVVS